MKFWRIILLSFLIGCFVSVAGLIILHSQHPQPTRPHPGNDMVGLAYGLAVGFNVILVICSLPVLFYRGQAGQKKWKQALLLFSLPLTFSLYAIIKIDVNTALYCIPYLLTGTVLLLTKKS